MTIFPSASSAVQSDEWKYDAIGGWLILITVGLCLSPLLQIGFVLTNLVPIFTKGTWSILTTPGTQAYHPLWGPLIILELVMNLLFIAMEAVLLFFLFKRVRWFPKAMIVYLLTVFVLVALDYFAAQKIPVVAAQNDAESSIQLVRAGIVCAIWIPYFLRSKRVKGTFVK